MHDEPVPGASTSTPCRGCKQRLEAAERTGYVAGLADSAQRRAAGCSSCRRDTLRLVLLLIAAGLLVGYAADVLLTRREQVRP